MTALSPIVWIRSLIAKVLTWRERSSANTTDRKGAEEKNQARTFGSGFSFHSSDKTLLLSVKIYTLHTLARHSQSNKWSGFAKECKAG